MKTLNTLAILTFLLPLGACAGSSPPGPLPTAPAPAAPAPLEQAAPAVEAASPEPTSAPPTPSGTQTPRREICKDSGAYQSPPITQTKAELLEDGFVFVEGPVWSDQLNALLFSEMDFNADGSSGPPSKIHLLTPDGKLFTYLEQSGSNGLAIDERGLFAATHDKQAVSLFDLTTKARSLVAEAVDGKKFNSPNDLTISSTGHIYFTDPDYQLGRRPKETGVTGVYWVKPDGTVTLVDGKLDKPNGISLSPDERTLYVASADSSVWAYGIDAGKPANRRRFAEVNGPDGMAVDCAGNLYVTSHGPGKLEVFEPGGKKLATVDVAPKTTNAAFGGPDRKTLYITAGTGVYSIQTAVPGYPY
jgi:gluconolactonase